MFNLRREQPIAPKSLDLRAVTTRTYGGLVLEMGDAQQHGSFEGFVRQPAKIGPVVYQQTSPTYAVLKPASASASSDDGSSTGVIIAIVAIVLLGGGAAFFLLRRRRTVYERE